MDIKIRVATPSDAQAVHDIYGSYVNEENVTFTIANPSVDEYKAEIERTLTNYPFLIAEDEKGRVLGYVCGHMLRPHDAYKWNVESTIMLSKEAPRRKKIATRLYEAFSKQLSEQGYKYIYAVIVDINEDSIKFHKALGFEQVGHFKDIGYKMGKWRGIIWMRKELKKIDGEPKDPLPFLRA